MFLNDVDIAFCKAKFLIYEKMNKWYQQYLQLFYIS